MSHFTVLVSAADEGWLEEIFAPYNEDISFDSPYAVWEDKTDEIEDDWNNHTIEVVVMEDGTYKFTWDDCFKVGKGFKQELVIPEHLERREVLLKEMYPDIDLFAEEYYGYCYNDSEESYGYWTNPVAKWDWWCVGGRWEGLLKLKDGTEVSSAYKGDVDWEFMRNHNVEREMERWDLYVKVLEQSQITVEEEVAVTDSEEKRAMWNRIRADNDAGEHYDLHKLWDFKPLALTREEHEKCAYKQRLTFAFIDNDGAWHEHAHMGWFAATWDEQPDYDQDFWNFVDSLDDDDMVFVVDCHI